MEAYIGSIIPFAFDYPPVDWAQCQGQTLQVSQNQALFAVIGNHYGGNGSTNFQLPNLCGRMPISIGPAQPTYNLPSYAIGNFGGQQTVALLTSNMPLHAHGTSAVSVSFQASTVANPNPPASSPSTNNPYLGASGGGTGLATIWNAQLESPVTVKGLGLSGNTDVAGGTTPVSVLNPFLALNFCIAVQGLFPTRQ
ncbi:MULTISPECIES: phage tail protein [Chromobacteriaceae]|uniref:Tail fiber protein n=3 Tax=Chromobacteriaceae TaxID=1499392 RepID=A0ABV0HBJ5_9NEIS|nr:MULTISPECIES: tail fiber protein [Chromobacteriaceae]MCD5330431.1 tail fiber protein [Chromobacterium piscinae]AVG15036.1 phage tail protein [Chromobacterium vaccinii]ERD99225.1 phage tail protein [Pseudogulbenkiania ferrooxidans EGD-HP2]MBX9296146.1 tail fiber protein [Chromobacterium vaccinii]MBX9355306.1 tail fiber protein [Chromobacterium vaccinii]